MRGSRITHDGLLAFFDKYVAADGIRRRRLTTHIFARKSSTAPPDALRMDAVDTEGFFPPEADTLLAQTSA